MPVEKSVETVNRDVNICSFQLLIGIQMRNACFLVENRGDFPCIAVRFLIG